MLIMTGNDNVGLDQAELSAAAVIAVRLHVWKYHSINSHKQFSSLYHQQISPLFLLLLLLAILIGDGAI
jgi:hypothetical protein